MRLIFGTLFGTAGAIKPEELTEQFGQVLTYGEEIEIGFKVIRDTFIFTNHRLIMVNIKGVGKKKEFLSIPYNQLSRFSIETTGWFDFDALMKIWINGVQEPIEYKLNNSVDVYAVGRTLSAYILNIDDAMRDGTLSDDLPDKSSEDVLTSGEKTEVSDGDSQFANLDSPPELTLISDDLLEFIDKFKPQLSKEKVYVYPDIPEKKLKNATESYVSDLCSFSSITPPKILILGDTTIFGSAKEGFCLSNTHLFVKKDNSNNDSQWVLDLTQLESSNIEVEIMIDDEANTKEKASIVIKGTTNGNEERKILNFSLIFYPETMESLAEILKHICQA